MLELFATLRSWNWK